MMKICVKNIYYFLLFMLLCLGQASSVAMQETNPHGQAEPTLQTIQQEQSHESIETTEDQSCSEQEKQSVQVPAVMPNIAPPQGRRRGRVRGRTPGQGSEPRRDMGRRCARKPSGL